MATILPGPTQGFNPLGFLVPTFQGLLQGQELGRERQDLQNLQVHQQALSQDPGANVGLPSFQSQRFRDFAGNQLFQNLGLANQAITPFQQQQLGIQRQAAGQLSPSAQTAEDKRQARLAIEAKLGRGDDVTEDVANFKTLFGGGQEINIDLGRTSAAEREALASGRASVDALDNLRTLHDNPKTRSGPAVGRIDPLLGLIGATTDEQESFLAASSSFENQLIKEITGAQMSVQEADRIMREVPRPTDPPKRWRAKWEQSRNNRIRLAKRRTEVLRQAGIRVPEDVEELANQKERPLSKESQKALQSPSFDRKTGNPNDIAKMTDEEFLATFGAGEPEVAGPGRRNEPPPNAPFNPQASFQGRPASVGQFQPPVNSQANLQANIRLVDPGRIKTIDALSDIQRSRVWQRISAIPLHEFNALQSKQRQQRVDEIIRLSRFGGAGGSF